MGNSAPKKRPSAAAAAALAKAEAKPTAEGEEPKKRGSVFGKRKSSLKSEKCVFNATLNEAEGYIRLHLHIQGGPDPTPMDGIVLVDSEDDSNILWSQSVSGEREDNVVINLAELAGHEGKRVVARYLTKGEECRALTDAFELPQEQEKKRQIGPCSLTTSWTAEGLAITYSIGTETSSSDYFAVSEPSSDGADYLFYEYASGDSSGIKVLDKTLFESYEDKKVEVRYFLGEDTTQAICKSASFLIPPKPADKLEERPKSVVAPAPAVASSPSVVKTSLSLRWKNDDVLLVSFSLGPEIHKPSRSDRVAISLVSPADSDTLNYESASGERTGSVELKRSSISYTLDPLDQQLLEARYYLASDSHKPIVHSTERVTLPKSASTRKSVAGAKPLPVKEDASVSPNKGFSLSVSWDPEQELLQYKIQPPKDVAITTSYSLWLVEASKKEDTSGNHGYAHFEKSYASGEEASGKWGIRFVGPPPVVKYRVLLTGEPDRTPVCFSEEFSFPAFPRSDLFPSPSPKLTATWDVDQQCIRVNWKGLGAQSDVGYYKYVYVYEAGVRNKWKQVIMHSLEADAWGEGEVEIVNNGKLRENVDYYVRLLENKYNDALYCFGCSSPFKVIQVEDLSQDKQICDFTVLGEEQETFDGFESSTCTVAWKFSRRVPGLAQTDQIFLVEADAKLDHNDWSAISCYASGKPEGKVTFSLGGLCKKGQAYRFYYVLKTGEGRVLGRSEPVVFTQLVEQSAEADAKAREASKKANMSSTVQHSFDAIKTVDEYNPLLTIKPEPGAFEKLLQASLNKRKKRRASADLRAEQQRAKALAAMQSKAESSKGGAFGDKPLTGTELFEMVLSDFNTKGGFIYAGAGVSMAAPASSPSWWVLMNDLLRETFNGAPEEHLDLRNKIAPGDVSRQPEEIMESFYFVLQDRLLTVFELLEAGEPNANHKAMAKLAKAGKLRGILTTNFDIFIERALRAEGVAFKTVVTAEEFQAYYESGCKDFAVLKIHGTVDRPSTIVAVANHYKSGKGFSGAKELVLGHFLRNHPTLFLGYSGWDFAHQNYQSFWAGEGEAGGENVYWLNLIGAKGPDLKKIVWTHIGKRLTIGEDMMPAWALNLLAIWDGSGAKEIADFDSKLDREAIQKSLLVKRRDFLQSWVGNIPKPQLLTLLQLEGAMLNEKVQERFKRMKEANKDAGEDAGMDTTMMTKLMTQMAMDMSAGKMSMEEYMEPVSYTHLTLPTKRIV